MAIAQLFGNEKEHTFKQRVEEFWRWFARDAEPLRRCFEGAEIGGTCVEDIHVKVQLFVFLDIQLGEYGTRQWIGRIEFGAHQLKEAIRLAELPRFILETSAREGWESRSPGERAVV